MGKTIAAILVILIVIFCLWLMQTPKPYFCHPDMTKQEKQMVKRALLKHGDWPVTREGESGIFYMVQKGKRIRL
jgi:hypothetical protein